LLFLSSNLLIQAQSKDEVLKLRNVFEVHQHSESYAFARDTKNEVQTIFSGLFLFYKYFVSSQDVVSCVFYPSCSVYALQTIQKNGIIVGTMATFDRLCRCNGLSPDKYDIHKESRLFYDPVQ
jgi:hypothetical protein